MPSTPPPLVLIHAFPLHSGMWEPQREALSGVVDIVTPDLPGFGNAPGLDDESFTMDRAAHYLGRDLEARGIDRFILGGLSMGGYVAFACLRQFRERIAGLILADTRASADSEEGQAGRYASAERIGRGEFDAVVEELLEKLLSRKTRSERPELVERVRRIMLETLPESAVAAQLGMAARIDSTDMLASIDVPTALIFGAEDAITTVEEGKAMAEKIPNARLHILPDAGHLSNLEDPEGFNAAVRELIEAVKR